MQMRKIMQFFLRSILGLILCQAVISCAPPSAPPAPITSTAEYDFAAPRVAWHHLTPEQRTAIESGLKAGQKPSIAVLHSSGSTSASASALDDNHRRVRGLSDGMAYHFVIGNGSGIPDGTLLVGKRWTQGQPAEAMTDARLAQDAVAICLIGEFNRDYPTRSQLEALDELLDFLETKIGPRPVRLHREVENSARNCPGENFPVKALRAGFPQ